MEEKKGEGERKKGKRGKRVKGRGKLQEKERRGWREEG